MMGTTFKVGDWVAANFTGNDIAEGKPYLVDRVTSSYVTVRDDANECHHLSFNTIKLVDAPEAPVETPKGTLERLLIEALPQGGYKITAPGQTWGIQHQDLSAHSTLKEAVAFITRNMR